MPNKKKSFLSFLLVLVFFTTSLLLLSFWLIQQNRNKPDEPLLLHNVVVSSEVDGKLRLTGSASRFNYGIRQICLRFDYSKADEGSEIRILWFSGEKVIQSDTYTLSTSAGSKLYCLLREDGQPLQRGVYSLGITHKSKLIHEFKFEIY